MENKIQTVVVKTVEIGNGIPKICVPVQGKSKKEILEQMDSISGFPCDLIEWRSDSFENVERDLEEILEVLKKKRKEKPLIFTYRTLREGGYGKNDAKICKDLGVRAIQSGNIDLLDVEYSMKEMDAKEMMKKAHTFGIKVIVSSHDFEKTPTVEEMIRKMCHMQETGADLIKQAVMPHSKEDVLKLLQATEEMNRLYAKRPLITMSMSDIGMISRYCGGVFGSAVTFAAGAEASAPGQPEANELKKVLSVLYKSI